jgi:hypothetical protein
MQPLYWTLSLFVLFSCNDEQQLSKPPQTTSEACAEALSTHFKEDHIAADFANFLAFLIDPAKLATLEGKRAATPQLRKA